MRKRKDKYIKKKPLKHRNAFKWLAMIFFLIGTITGFTGLSIQNSEAASHENIVDESKAPKEKISCAELFPGLDLQTTTQESRFYTSSINQPVTQVEDINKEIEKWINQEKTKFVINVEKKRNQTEDQDFHGNFTIETEVSEIADGIYIIDLTATGVNGRKEIKPFMIDLNIKRLVKAEDIFELELDEETEKLFQQDQYNVSNLKDYTLDYISLSQKEEVAQTQNVFELNEKELLDWEKNQELKELVLKELKMSAEIGPYLYEELSKKALSNTENWRLTVDQNGVNFYFDQSEIAQGKVGTIKTEIPIEKIQKHLNIEVFEKLGLDVPQEKLVLEPGGKYIALTFDDGPHPILTPRVLSILKEYDATATFFMGGHQAEYNPEIVKQMKEDGHELGDHTLNHLQLSKLSDAEIRTEISESSRRIAEAGGAMPTVMRPPYGDYDERVERITEEMDLPMIMWSVDTLDWKNRNPQAIINKTMPAATPGGIILMHDIHVTTVDAVPQMIQLLRKDGYEFVTVSQLIDFWDNEETHVYYGGDAREMRATE